MAKITRYDGNFKPFAANSTGTNRTVFGDATTQSDNLTDNITGDFLTGWEIVGPNDKPKKQDFNALGFTYGQVLSYLHQMGIPEWNTSQEYHIGSRAIGSNGELYRSKTNTNTANNPTTDSTNWGRENENLSGRNIIINGGFTINQRNYVSGATLAAGSYGHDRWKAGAGGGNYSFTQLNSNTNITIQASKTLIQVIENKNVHNTRYLVSWEGTSLARVGVNSDTPAGTFVASPIVVTGQTPGTVMSVEFGSGTLGKVQIEASVSSVPTIFEQRSFGDELIKCQRYYELLPSCAVMFPWNSATQVVLDNIYFAVTKRAIPTVALGSKILGTGTLSVNSITIHGAIIAGNGLLQDVVAYAGGSASAEL
jgi:hypothetical protein